MQYTQLICRTNKLTVNYAEQPRFVINCAQWTMWADLGHAPSKVVYRPTSSPLVPLYPFLRIKSDHITRKRERTREREISKATPLPLSARSGAQSSYSAPLPFSAAFSCPLSRKQLRHSNTRTAVIPLGPPLCTRCNVKPIAFAVIRALSLNIYICITFTPLCSFLSSLVCTFSLILFNFLLIPVSWRQFFLSPLLVLFFFSLFYSLLFFLFQQPCDAAHTRAPHCLTRASLALLNTHGRSRPLLLTECAVLPPAGDHVTWPPGRSNTQRAARAVLSHEPRTRHQSETNRESEPTDHTFSFLRNACGAFFLLLSFRVVSLFFFCSLYPAPLSPFFLSFPFFARVRARYITLWALRASPRYYYHPKFPHVFPVLCICAVTESL